MRVYDYSQIDLSEKYEKLFDRFKESRDERVQWMEFDRDFLYYQRDTLSEVRDEMRTLRLNFVGAKRRAIYGTIGQEEIDAIQEQYETVVEKLKELGETDRSINRLYRETNRLNPEGTLNSLLASSEFLSEEEKSEKVMEDDRVTRGLNTSFMKVQSAIAKIDRRRISLRSKIDRETLRADREKFNFKVSLSNLESFEESAQNLLRSFYSSYNIKV